MDRRFFLKASAALPAAAAAGAVSVRDALAASPDGGPWRSFEAVEYATLEWVDWFNHRRLLEPIGNIPPAEAEEQYYAMTQQQPMAA